MKITMTVHHGETKQEIVCGETFGQCIDKLIKTPLFVGYGPRGDRVEMMEKLRDEDFSWGWADYRLTVD